MCRANCDEDKKMLAKCMTNVILGAIIYIIHSEQHPPRLSRFRPVMRTPAGYFF